MTLYLISQIFAEIYNLGKEHSTEKKQGSDSSLQPVLSNALHWEPLSTIFVFSVNDHLPDLPNFPEMDNLVWEQAREKK